MITRFLSAPAILLIVISEMALANDAIEITTDPSIHHPRQPQAAVDSSGSIHITFGAAESVYCTTSTDRGKTYSQPVLIDDLSSLALGMRRGPRIAASSQAVVVTAIDRGTLKAWRSTDTGKTWHGPTQVNDSLPHAREGLHAMAVSPTGIFFCVWLDDRHDGMQLFGSRSTDRGKTWSENIQVYRSPSGSICECCHPAVTFDNEGNLHVMWRNSLADYRDLYHRVSTDGGQTFAEATRLGTGSWELPACPMDGGWIAATGAKQVTTVWRREKNIYRTDSARSQEQMLGRGEQPWVARNAKGAYVVWLSKRYGDLWLATPQASKPVKLSSQANDPVVTAPLKGKGPVIVVWEEGKKRQNSIRGQVIRD